MHHTTKVNRAALNHKTLHLYCTRSVCTSHGIHITSDYFLHLSHNNNTTILHGTGAVCSDYGGIPIEVDGFEQVCCASSCEPCGGSGCSSDDGGAQSCCADGITNAGKICSGDADAPCLMSPAPSMTDSVKKNNLFPKGSQAFQGLVLIFFTGWLV